MRTCNTGVCQCSASPGPIIAEMVLGIGETTCVAWDAGIAGGMKVLSFVLPIQGGATGAKGLFKAAGKVFKYGSKTCTGVCRGHEYTVVDPNDIKTQLGLLDCGVMEKREEGERLWVA